MAPIIRHIGASEELCICLLAKADHIFAKDIIIKGKHDLIHSLCECSVNILKGNVSLKKCQKSKLRRYRKDLRALVITKTGLHLGKRILQK